MQFYFKMEVSQNLAQPEIEDTNAVQQNPQSQNITLKQYFDEKLHAALSAALNACAEEKPDDPITFVGNYLLSNTRSV